MYNSASLDQGVPSSWTQRVVPMSLQNLSRSLDVCLPDISHMIKLGTPISFANCLTASSACFFVDRIPSTTPGAEPPRDAKDSGSARSHSMHLETSSSDRPKMVTYTEPQTVPSYMSVKCTRGTLHTPNFTRATHAQPSLSYFPWRDSDFGERTRSRGMTLGEQKFPTSPQNKITKLTHCSIYVPMRTISTRQIK